MTAQNTNDTHDRVIIRKFIRKVTPEQPFDDLVAFIPDAPANFGFIMSYQHVGQHSEASLGFYEKSCASVDYDTPEVKALVTELQSIGYNVKLCKRLNRPFGGWAK